MKKLIVLTLLCLSGSALMAQTQNQDINMSNYKILFPAGGVGGRPNEISSRKLSNTQGEWKFQAPYSSIYINAGINENNPRNIYFNVGSKNRVYISKHGMHFNVGGVGGSTNLIKSYKRDENHGDWLFDAPFSDIILNAGKSQSNTRAVYFKIGNEKQVKIDKNGLTAKEIKVTLSGWSDFVFEEDYELRELNEVESYISEKGHLPDIPSAAEVEADGISLGEMDAKLLQKIEELTLYLIEQNKTIKELQEEVQELKSK
ncbi:hypothetical protein [Reichenbachiella versicolor]|uniref:hypothetical protein n=1 Tax=Reichenbachiella versicolor TaxID=1821036 RepID=UPI000D6E7FF5|nr:hypothetical protein [Reichenbachiella versicolor]